MNDEELERTIREWANAILKAQGQALCELTLKPEKDKDDVAKLEQTERKYQVVGFERTGTKMVLPDGMDYAEAIYHLELKQKEEETPISIREEIDAYPYDGAYILMKVLADRYGWASPAPTPGFFGPKPPTMVGFEIGPNKHTQVIWGGFKMPGIEGDLQTGSTTKGNRLIFVIAGTVKKKHEHEVMAIAQAVRERIAQESVYKAKAIRLTTDEDGDLIQDEPPRFIDTKGVRENELVLPEEVEEQVRTCLWTPIEKTELCRKHRVPLKIGICFEGKFGTGKTLTAYVTAKKCVENGWTYIYLDRVGGLKSAIEFARQYEPAVIFAEDIDRIVSGEERTEEIDDVLNTIDGIESKNTEIITVLTTNDIEKVNRAMLRPGRLDAIITFTAPDKTAAEKLVRIYAQGLVAQKTKLPESSQELSGQIPAVIREVVERAKRHAISRLAGDEEFQLADLDLARAARGMKHHLKLMAPPTEVVMSTEEELGASLREIVDEAVKGAMEGREIKGDIDIDKNTIAATIQ